jgi:hypothetical protein
MFGFFKRRVKKDADYADFDVSRLLDLIYRGNPDVLEMENLRWKSVDGTAWCGAKFTFTSRQSAQEARDLVQQTFPFMRLELSAAIHLPVLLARWPIRDYSSDGGA